MKSAAKLLFQRDVAIPLNLWRPVAFVARLICVVYDLSYQKSNPYCFRMFWLIIYWEDKMTNTIA